MKKLYKVQFAKHDLNDQGAISVVHTRFFEVAAVDAGQAVRKVKYSLTRKKLSFPTEFIDTVTRVGLIEIK